MLWRSFASFRIQCVSRSQCSYAAMRLHVQQGLLSAGLSSWYGIDFARHTTVQWHVHSASPKCAAARRRLAPGWLHVNLRSEPVLEKWRYAIRFLMASGSLRDCVEV